MVTLILDTNIWIYLAKGEHPKVLQKLIEKHNNKEIQFLISSIQIEEWDRNKIGIIDQIKEAIIFQIQNAQTISGYLDGDEKKLFNKILSEFKNKKESILNAADDRYKIIEDLIKNKSIIADVTSAEKIEVSNWALQKKAPFHRNSNSYADALILLSTSNYIQNNSLHKSLSFGETDKIIISDSVFITYNSDDFSLGIKGLEKDIVHPDLKPIFDKTMMRFERNIGKILDISEELEAEIASYWGYIDDLIDSHIEWEAEIMRGK
ncbi:DUF4935 domain-containing protein [Flavobacterium sp. MR2016-29]|uniref:PIN domain-containing protein n=1 Tax=Flavobacterium sp. MR2016-29 TaxID=2783795 RepID=UPI00188DA2E0|nr:PIN domain-containing protein [Flavobacterium sp. MR2016-29]MBF4491484.1 DUF4935 domain-containing protein [Flavobacterium sp. MR2016-29]